MEALRASGWDIDILAHVRRGGRVLGLCGGYQMLGRTIADPDGVEGRRGTIPGLGLLTVDTVLGGDKATRPLGGPARGKWCRRGRLRDSPRAEASGRIARGRFCGSAIAPTARRRPTGWSQAHMRMGFLPAMIFVGRFSRSSEHGRRRATRRAWRPRWTAWRRISPGISTLRPSSLSRDRDADHCGRGCQHQEQCPRGIDQADRRGDIVRCRGRSRARIEPGAVNLLGRRNGAARRAPGRGRRQVPLPASRRSAICAFAHRASAMSRGAPRVETRDHAAVADDEQR